MKPIEEVTAVVYDYGTFQSLAEKLAETLGKVYYYTPFEDEYRDINRCLIGEGMERVERLNEPVSVDTFELIDLWVFPDIGWGKFQRWLKSKGKLVWGPSGADQYELYRTRFLKLLEDLDLPVVPSEKVLGITALRASLQEVENKWIKVNVFRANMETWFHKDFDHSRAWLDELSVRFAMAPEKVLFIIQDPVDGELEIGYDGWCVDGQYPELAFQGYEKKNQLYLGSCRSWSELPDEVRMINEAFAPLMRDIGYRCFMSWEARIADGVVYCIDPTYRMPGQTGEQLLETCDNLPDVIYQGANGILIPPKFNATVAAEATLHWTGESETKVLRVPDEAKRWCKLYAHVEDDGVCRFPPGKNDELGVVLGVDNSDSIEGAVAHLKDNLELLKDEPVSAAVEGFMELVEIVRNAEDAGIEFVDEPIPESGTVATAILDGNGSKS